jgi:hypothetical protein
MHVLSKLWKCAVFSMVVTLITSVPADATQRCALTNSSCSLLTRAACDTIQSTCYREVCQNNGCTGPRCASPTCWHEPYTCYKYVCGSGAGRS